MTFALRGNRLLWLALAIIIGFSFRPVRRAFWPTPAESLQKFYAYGAESGSGVAEDMLMDPLILAGDGVVPLVLERLPNPQMPKRRYAIGFLGNGAYTQALPALRTMLADQREPDLFRGDALRAICSIDPAEGKRTAPDFASRDDFLGSSAREIGERGCAGQRRTRAQAVAGQHD